MNKVMLMGRLTRDPELRATQSGVSVTTFSIAVDRRFQKPGEERQADFFNIVCFNRGNRTLADFVKRYFVKGQLVALDGSLQTRTWDGQDGKKNYVTEIIADDVYFTGDRRDQNGQSGQQQQSNNNWQRPDDSGYAPDGPANDGFMTVSDDQLPF